MVTKAAKKQAPEKATESTGLAQTRRVLVKMGLSGDPQPVGAIPLWDGKDWHWVYNKSSIPAGAENCADPAKIETLRRTAAAVLTQDTIAQLVSVGCKVNSLLASPIKNFKDVKRWADSIFNWGPGTPKPHDAVGIAYDDFKAWHPETSSVVVPVGQRGSGDGRVKVLATNDYEWWKKLQRGHEVVLGPRHEISKAAFAAQVEAQKATETAMKRTTAKVEKHISGPHRGRGRPRKDGLLPGSPEALAADEARKAGQPIPDWIKEKMGADPHQYAPKPTRKAQEGPVQLEHVAKVIHIESTPRRRTIRRQPRASTGS